MAEIKAVPDEQPDPKAGKPKPRSGVRFPYYDLEHSIDVARIMHVKAGGKCSRAQLAALLDYSGVNNGGFLSAVAAAKMFGLVEQQDDQLNISTRAQTILSPVSAADADRAKVEAFLSVDLFKKVFDQYDGQALPAEVGLNNLLSTQYNVVPTRVTPTVRIMLDSAEQAGMFKTAGNRSRMVMPVLSPSTGMQAAPKPSDTPPTPPAHEQHGGGGGNGSGTQPPNIPAAILGLLSRLPEPGTAMSGKKRAALIAAFTATVQYLYPDVELEELLTG